MDSMALIAEAAEHIMQGGVGEDILGEIKKAFGEGGELREMLSGFFD